MNCLYCCQFCMVILVPIGTSPCFSLIFNQSSTALRSVVWALERDGINAITRPMTSSEPTTRFISVTLLFIPDFALRWRLKKRPHRAGLVAELSLKLAQLIRRISCTVNRGFVLAGRRHRVYDADRRKDSFADKNNRATRARKT